MIAVATFNDEQSLRAMWHAFRASSVVEQQLVEIDAGVVGDLLNARYYESTRGQFLSQDPVFWEIGLAQDGKKTPHPQQGLSSTLRTMDDGWSKNNQSRVTSMSQMAEYLADPQIQNSYSYARGNPIRFKDPDGLWYKEFFWDNIRTFGNGQTWASFRLELGEAANQLAADDPAWDYAFEHPVQTGAAVGVASGFGASSAAGGIILGSGFNPTIATVGMINAYGWKNTAQSYVTYKATGSQSARNQAAFDGVVFAAYALGNGQHKQALNMLTAALTTLEAALPSIVQSATQQQRQ